MSNTVIIGLQWGDEGKGKIVDLLCPAFDAVVRYQGGHNAGHTVKFGQRHFSLHLIPSGIVHPGMQCVIGNGVVLSPEAFFTELDRLAGEGVDPTGRLFLSDRLQLLLPGHAQVDQARELAAGDQKIGTTSRGIGPAYECKAARLGLRPCDLFEPGLADRLHQLTQHQEAELGRPVEPTGEALLAQVRAWAERLRPYLADTGVLLALWIGEGKSLLFEGAQGTLLDVDHGTYPYVTSSSATAGGACTGSGVPPTALDGVIGILKAYTSRVGEGPFVTELHDAVGEHLRERGTEYGTTTGRPRRCGWLDLVASSYARRINGVGAIALTKLDVLDDCAEIPVCVAYRLDGREITDFPASTEALARAEPVYEVLPGWQSSTVGATEESQLPPAARAYVRYIEERVGAPIALISTGPRREETILRRELPVVQRLLGDGIERVLTVRDGR
jgi:adenylosuccinate synthase